MIIDALKYIIQADGRDAEKGVQQVRKSTDELTESMKKSENQAEKTMDSMASAAKKVIGLVASVAAVKAAIIGAMARADEIHQLNETSKALGSNIEDVDALAKAFQSAGFTGEKAFGLLQKTSEMLGMALNDSESAQAKLFASLGVNLRKANGDAVGASEAVLSLAGALEGMGKSAAQARLAELGITDPETVGMMLRGRVELENMARTQKELGVTTKETAEKSEAFHKQVQRLKLAFARLRDGKLEMLFKPIGWAIEKVSDIVENHQEEIEGFFVAVGIAAAAYTVRMIAAAVATNAAIWPLVLTVAAVAGLSAAFVVLYGDIERYRKGQKSMIGDMEKDFPAMAELTKMIGKSIEGFFGYLSDVGVILGDLLYDLWVLLQDIASFLSTAFSGLGDKIFGEMGIAKKGVDLLVSSYDKLKSGVIGGFLGLGGEDEAKAGAKAFYAHTAAASREPINSMSSGAIANGASGGNRETNVSVGQVVVHTQATDAKGMAGAANSELSKELMSLQTESSSGVAR